MSEVGWWQLAGGGIAWVVALVELRSVDESRFLSLAGNSELGAFYRTHEMSGGGIWEGCIDLAHRFERAD
jgi:hypothetical protein